MSQYYTYAIYKAGETFCGIDIAARVCRKDQGVQGNLEHWNGIVDPNTLQKVPYEKLELVYSTTDLTPEDGYKNKWDGSSFVSLTTQELTEWNTFIANATDMWNQRKNKWDEISVDLEKHWKDMTIPQRKTVKNIKYRKFSEDDWDELGLDTISFIGNHILPMNEWLPFKKIVGL